LNYRVITGFKLLALLLVRSHIATGFVLLLVLVGVTLKNALMLYFQSDWDEIWQHFSSSKYTSIDGVRLLI